MQTFKSLAIKIGLVAVVLGLLASPMGKEYADNVKPLIDMVISQ